MLIARLECHTYISGWIGVTKVQKLCLNMTVVLCSGPLKLHSNNHSVILNSAEFAQFPIPLGRFAY